jgi:hypothetical protein
MQTKLRRGDTVGIVVDGEIFTDAIIVRKGTGVGMYLVKIPFYYSRSEKNGQVVENNWLCVEEHIDFLIF